MSILICGGNGFLGRSVCRRLIAKGLECHILVNKNIEHIEDLSAYCLRFDELTQMPQDSFNFIVDCAACIPDDKSNYGVSGLSETNALMPAKISRLFPTAKYVYSSSVAVYGQNSNSVNENSPFDQFSAYGHSKLVGEYFVKAHPGGYAIIRFSSLYGIGLQGNTIIPSYIKSVRQSNLIKVYGDGSRCQNYLYVDDAVSILEHVIDNQIEGIILGVNNKSVSNLELANCIIQFTDGAQIEFSDLPQGLSYTYEPHRTLSDIGVENIHSIQDGIKKMMIK